MVLDYISNINALYTGCTRARDYLYIIVSNKGVYSQVLQEACEVKIKE